MSLNNSSIHIKVCSPKVWKRFEYKFDGDLDLVNTKGLSYIGDGFLDEDALKATVENIAETLGNCGIIIADTTNLGYDSQHECVYFLGGEVHSEYIGYGYGSVKKSEKLFFMGVEDIPSWLDLCGYVPDENECEQLKICGVTYDAFLGSYKKSDVIEVSEDFINQYLYENIEKEKEPLENDVTVIGNGVCMIEGVFICGDAIEMPDMVIPDGAVRIAERAFYSCRDLKSVVIPDSVRVISGEAFCSCINLKSVTIPASIVKIERNAFDKCKNLTDIIISGIDESDNNCESYEKNAVYGRLIKTARKNAEKIKARSESKKSVSKTKKATKEKIELSTDGKKVKKFNFRKNAKNIDIRIPYGVEEIVCESPEVSMSRLFLPKELRVLSKGMLKAMYGASLEGPAFYHIEVERGSEYFAADETGFYSINDGKKTLEGIYDKGITEYVAPDDVSYFADDAFAGCYDLTEIVLSENMEVFNEYAIPDESPIDEIYIPSNVKDIRVKHTYDVPGKKQLRYRISEENYMLFTDEDSVYKVLEDGTYKLVMNRYTGRGKALIREDVSEIGDYAFFDHRYMTDIDLPDGLKVIGASAFEISEKRPIKRGKKAEKKDHDEITALDAADMADDSLFDEVLYTDDRSLNSGSQYLNTSLEEKDCIDKYIYLRETGADGRADTIEKISVGEKIHFARSDNECDKYRIEAFTEQGSVGYLPSQASDGLADLLYDGDAYYSAYVTEVVPLSKRNRRAKSPIVVIHVDIKRCDENKNRSEAGNACDILGGRNEDGSWKNADMMRKYFQVTCYMGEYSYLCDFDAKEGEEVNIPIGNRNWSETGTVTSIKICTETNAPYPPERTKYIYGRADDEKSKKIRDVRYGSSLYDNSGLKRINIPQSVMRIGKRAFYGCRLEGNIVLADTVLEVGTDAFPKAPQNILELMMSGCRFGAVDISSLPADERRKAALVFYLAHEAKYSKQLISEFKEDPRGAASEMLKIVIEHQSSAKLSLFIKRMIDLILKYEKELKGYAADILNIISSLYKTAEENGVNDNVKGRLKKLMHKFES